MCPTYTINALRWYTRSTTLRYLVYWRLLALVELTFLSHTHTHKTSHTRFIQIEKLMNLKRIAFLLPTHKHNTFTVLYASEFITHYADAWLRRGRVCRIRKNWRIPVPYESIYHNPRLYLNRINSSTAIIHQQTYSTKFFPFPFFLFSGKTLTHLRLVEAIYDVSGIKRFSTVSM